MDSIKIKAFVKEVECGKSDRQAYRAAFDENPTEARIQAVKDAPIYATLVNAVRQVAARQIRDEVQDLKLKKVKAYSSLLDEGTNLIKKANSTDDVDAIVKAQENQRRNLNVTTIEDSTGWDINSPDYADALEGVIIE